MSENDISQLIGHTDVQTTLNQLLESGKLPHALLFHGPKGIGKRLTAEVLARRILCGEAQSLMNDGLTYDETSSIFPQILAGSCPDFYVIQPAEGKASISVEQVRNSISQLALSSENDRVVIIDAAEQMTIPASNALLKTLEEPGSRIHIILISHNLSKLLPTIVSRCRRYRFAPLAENESLQVIKTEQGDLSSEIEASLQVFQGCPGQAIEMAEKGKKAIDAIEDALNKGKSLKGWQITELTEKLQQQKIAGMAMDFLLAKVAQFAKEQSANSAKFSMIYQQLNKRRQDMEEFNISPQLTLETSLHDVVSSM